MNPFIQLFATLFDMYVGVILLRFFLQYFKADFYSPLSQFAIKATDPLVKPLRRIIPGFSGIDFSTLILAWIMSLLKLVLVMLIAGQIAFFKPVQLVLHALVETINVALMLFVFLIFLRIILSFVAQGGYNPVIGTIMQLTEPLLAPIRRKLPPMSGFDLSPMIALLLIFFVQGSLYYFLVPLFN